MGATRQDFAKNAPTNLVLIEKISQNYFGHFYFGHLGYQTSI